VNILVDTHLLAQNMITNTNLGPLHPPLFHLVCQIDSYSVGLLV